MKKKQQKVKVKTYNFTAGVIICQQFLLFTVSHTEENVFLCRDQTIESQK